MTDSLRERIERALHENGISGNIEALHSWRCAYPDRYGDCTCVAELVDDLLAAVNPPAEHGARSIPVSEVAGIYSDIFPGRTVDDIIDEVRS